MKSIGHLRIYLGTPGWGWIMYGIGWKNIWFLGFSVNQYPKKKVKTDVLP